MSTPKWLEVGLPSLDRPFGLHLWPIFSRAWEAVNGYPAEEFRFVQGKTTLSTFKSCVLSLITYYIVVLGGREVMRNREPFKFNFFFKLHNFYLTAISGMLLVLFLEQLIPTVVRHGVFFAVCDHAGGWTDKLVVLYYVGTSLSHLAERC
jgi:fatty acid elongase 3